MPRVFVTNDPGSIDLTKAEKFGTIVRVTTGRLNVYKPENVLATVDACLQSFDAEDFLLMAGGALSILAAGLSLPELPSLKLLVYDVQTQDYFVRSIDTRT